MEARLIFPEYAAEKNKALLFIHGWGSNQDGYMPRAKALAGLGYIGLTFSLRGHGKSSGSLSGLSRQDFLNDAVLAYDYLKNQKNVNPEKIGVVGASFGGYLAVLLTKQRNIKWLALRALANFPDDGFKDVAQVKYPRNDKTTYDWRRKKLFYPETMALSALHQYKNDVLIVESGRDEIVPHQCVQNYADAVLNKSKLTYIVMPDADHIIREEKYHRQFIQILSDWFASRS